MLNALHISRVDLDQRRSNTADPHAMFHFRFRALTMCHECHARYHSDSAGSGHVTQNLFPDPWTLQGPEQAYPTEAVIRLLAEAKPCLKTRNEAMGSVYMKL